MIRLSLIPKSLRVDPNYIAKAMRFESEDFFAPAIYESDGGKDFVNFKYQMIAMDSTAAIAYNPFGGISGNEKEAEHLDFWRL